MTHTMYMVSFLEIIYVKIKFCLFVGVFHQISRISSSEVVGPSPVKSEIVSLLGSSSSGPIPSSLAALSSGSSTSFSRSLDEGVPSSMPTSSSNVRGVVHTSIPLLPSVPQLQIPVMNVNVPAPPPLTPLPMQIQPMPLPVPVSVPHLPPSPYGLCLGGFFMQQPSSVSESNEPSTSSSLAGSAPASSLLDASQALESTKEIADGVLGAEAVSFGSAPSIMQAESSSGANLKLASGIDYVESTGPSSTDSATPSSSRGNSGIDKRADEVSQA